MGSHASRDARAVLDAIRRVVRLLRQSAREAEKRTGLSAAQLFVLQQLRAAGGALTPGELAERTLTHQSSISVVVKRLVAARLVSRARSPSDRRRVELSLTPAAGARAGEAHLGGGPPSSRPARRAGVRAAASGRAAWHLGGAAADVLRG